MTIFKSISDVDVYEGRYSPLVQECREIFAKEKRYQIQHMLREVNKCADWLANLALESAIGKANLEEPPRELQLFLFHDRSGISVSHIVPNRA